MKTEEFRHWTIKQFCDFQTKGGYFPSEAHAQAALDKYIASFGWKINQSITKGEYFIANLEHDLFLAKDKKTNSYIGDNYFDNHRAAEKFLLEYLEEQSKPKESPEMSSDWAVYESSYHSNFYYIADDEGNFLYPDGEIKSVPNYPHEMFPSELKANEFLDKYLKNLETTKVNKGISMKLTVEEPIVKLPTLENGKLYKAKNIDKNKPLLSQYFIAVLDYHSAKSRLASLSGSLVDNFDIELCPPGTKLTLEV